MTNSITTIIPAAGLSSRLRPISNFTSKSMIPVNGKPTISYIIDQVKEYSDDIRIVYGKSDDIMQYCKRAYPDLPISFYHQENPKGPLHALSCALEDADSECTTRDLLVWLGDTIVLDYYPSEKASEVVYGEVDDWERWCLIDNHGKLHDKPSYNPKTNKALVGIYKFPNFFNSSKSIKEIINNKSTINGEYQISQLIEEYNDILQTRTREWYDCGDFPSLYESRAKLLNRLSRDDNSISVDTITGTITKSGKRCRSEIEWYKTVPSSIKPFLPTIYKMNDYSYTMDYCPGTSLQDILVYEKLKDDTIEYTLNKVLQVYDICFIDNQQTSFNKSSLYMWIDKNLDRFKDYEKYEFIDKNDLLFVESVVESKSFKSIIEQNNFVNTVHGDLHFGNILFDYNTGKVKLIDPRGNWNNCITTNGDIEYDIAKMYQSCFCEYMWIVNNMQVDYQLKVKLISILDNRFSNSKNHKIRACIMMASCLPFHNDNKERQKRIWNTSIKLLKRLV